MHLNTFDGVWFIGFTVIVEEGQIVLSLASDSLFKLALGHLFFLLSSIYTYYLWEGQV